MIEVDSVYTQGIIAAIEVFTIADEELRQFVIYTYYDKAERPLYVGASKSFYDAHYFNSKRLGFFEEIEYVGFVFLENEENMKESKPYYIRARQPQYARSKYPKLPYLKGCDVSSDDFVVSVKEMEQRWREWLGPDNGEFDKILSDRDKEWEEERAAWPSKIMPIVKIKGREFTETEMAYVMTWFDRGVDERMAKKAYETTVIRTGKLTWPYMHRLLLDWTDINAQKGE